MPTAVQKASSTPTGMSIDLNVRNCRETSWMFWIEKIAIAILIANLQQLLTEYLLICRSFIIIIYH